MVSKGTPEFISWMVCSSNVWRYSAVLTNASRTRSFPIIGGPCPGRIIRAFSSFICSRLLAQSPLYRCTFCGLPALGAVQTNRSPVQIVSRSGICNHRASSVSPRAGLICTVTDPTLSSVGSLISLVGRT